MKTRLLSIFLLLCMLLSTLPALHGADVSDLPAAELETVCEGAYEKLPLPSELPYGPDTDDRRYLSPSDDWETEAGILFAVEQDLKAAIKNGEDTLDVSKYQIYPSQVNLLVLRYYSPYISGGIDINCWYYKDSYYSKIDIICPLSKSEVSARFAEIDAKVAEVSALVSERRTQLEKVLFLHDYFVYTGEYDYDDYLAGTIPEDSYRSAGILMNREGVCQSYAYAMKYFLHREGIECHVASSDSMNHAWNIVKLGNDYYHIDVTWDDPTPDTSGQVLHNYFLVSDSAISSKRGESTKTHYGWDRTELVCSNTLYDNAFWTYAKSFIWYLDNSFYFIREDGIVKRDYQSGEENHIKTFDKWYTQDGKSYWIGSFSGLWLNGTKLYYNTDKSVGCIDVNTLNDRIVFTPSIGNESIYGSRVYGDTFYYQVSLSPNDVGTVYSKDLHSITGDPSLKLDRNAVSLKVGESIRLTPTVKNGTYNGVFFWESSNTSVAQVNGEGTVSANAAGSTIITVHTDDGLSAICLVTVSDDGNGDEDLPITDSSLIFKDVKKTSWFKSAVDFVVDRGLMNGTSADVFAPNAPMNRAMLVTVLWRMEGSPITVTENPFTDLKQSWYRDAVAWAYANDIVNGTGDTAFSPGKSITREQMAAILYRYSSYKQYDTTARADVTSYPDGNRISSYAVEAMSWANGGGLITGKASGDSIKLAPRGNATRAEVATILQRYLNMYK